MTYIIYRRFTLQTLLAVFDPFGPWGAFSMANAIERHAVTCRDAVRIEADLGVL
jgi:hypothetical protein